MTTDSPTFVSAISATLTCEGWALAEVRTPQPGDSAAAFTGPDRTVRLTITHEPGEPIVAELTGHAAGCPSAPIWSATITDPTETQLLATVRAAAEDRLRAVLNLASRLQKASWKLNVDESSETLCQITSAGGRTLTRLDSAGDTPGGWVLDCDGLQADASDGIPTSVLAALAITPRQEPTPSLDPGTTDAEDLLEPAREPGA